MVATARPAPFSVFTTPEFWDDPDVSASMLACHLDPHDARASRTHEFIDRSVDWLIAELGLTAGSRLLDLGCGPGLYAHRLARAGVNVLGIDASRRSLDHARTVATAEHLPAVFRHGDYLVTDLGAGHDAAILIYEDYCALSPDQRHTLLRRVQAALAPGGAVVFDVTSAARFDSFSESSETAENLMGGFWSRETYVGTHERWVYPELRLLLDRYTIVAQSSTRQFWNWIQCLTPAEVVRELADCGFGEVELFGDVTGAPFDPDGATFAVVARRLEARMRAAG